MSTLETGSTVAGYRIESVLGHGSMGTVYSAHDIALDRRIALKVLTPELARDERFRERFLRESKLAAGLEHPHIVPIHAAGEADGVLYLAMRYVDGRDLSALLESLGRLDSERTLAILTQVADALDTAHGRGLVHRDVKPANILLAKGDYAYLCDFGLAKHASTVSSLTGSRAILGTVDYLAPEQIEAKPVDARVDVYALGCVLYECLVGEPPFRRDNELAALLAHVNDPVPTPSERRAELPPAIDDVVATALAKDRDARFSSAAELVVAADAALSGGVPELPAAPQPTAPAVRTFLFADVRGYTSYTREHGDEAGAALARQFAEIVERIAPGYTGSLQELRGDEALVVFDSARAALRFAIELQAAVVTEELPRPVGIGIDTGEAVPVEDGFRGGALNRAARLCALAKPGEVLASDAVRELAGATEGIAFGFRRIERLKGFDKPVGVVEVHHAETAPGRELGRSIKRAAAGTHPRRRAALVVGIVAVAIAIVAAVGLTGGSAKAFPIDSVGLLDTNTLGRAGAITDLGKSDGLWADSVDTVWSYDKAARALTGVDEKSRKVTARFPASSDACEVLRARGSLWVANCKRAEILRLDPQYGTVTKRIELPKTERGDAGFANELAFGAGSIWVSYGAWPFHVARIDPRTNRVIKTIDLKYSDGEGRIDFGDGSLWVASNETGGLERIDPSTNVVAATGKLHGGSVEDIKALGGYAWVAIHDDGGVWKVDEQGNVLKLISTGDLPWMLAHDGQSLFVANLNSGTVSRIDPTTDAVETTVVGHRPQSMAVADGAVWVAVQESAADARVGLDSDKTLTISMSEDYFWLTDPALAAFGNLWQLQYAAGARLLRAPDRAEPRGARLLPEIASLPTISNGGRTYTFRIRPGYKFSPPSNAPVTAEVMRHSIERAISPALNDDQASGWRMVSDIEGLEAYRDGKAAHVSGIRVNGDRLSITLIFPAADFPTRISLPAFSAVPLETPAVAHGVESPVPSAGPYYIASSLPDSQTVLKRNPNYAGPRKAGFDAIVAEVGIAPAVGAQRVQAGKADYVFSVDRPYPPALAPGGALDRQFGAKSAAAKRGDQRYAVAPVSGIRMVSFNALQGAFKDARLRRAVEYALDRPALAAVRGDAPSADPIPPGVPGSGSQIDYPLDRPNLARARALAGRGRHTVTMLVPPGDVDPDGAAIAAIVKRNLARIGISVRLSTVANPFGEVAQGTSRWDLVENGWLADWADPSNFLNGLFDPTHMAYGWTADNGWTAYADQRFIARMRKAYSVGGAARASAYRSLATEMMRVSPPVAVFGRAQAAPQLFSSRVGCQVYRPQDSGWVDLAALCRK